nr:hypothetical protein [Tanacetum cinerariifolium]
NSEEIDLHEEHFVLPIWSSYSTTIKSSGDKIEKNTNSKTYGKETTHENQNADTNSTNIFNTVSTPLSVSGPSRAFNNGELSYLDDPLMPHLEDISASLSEGIFTDSSYDDEGVVTDFNNLETTVNVSLTPTTRIHTVHPKTQILGDPMLVVQTRSKVKKNSKAHALVSYIQKQQRNNHKDFQNCLFACFLPQIKPKKISQVLEDESLVDTMQKELLQFQNLKGFIVYQMDVRSAFLYGTIDVEVYVSQPPGFVDPKFPNKVYKVVKALYGLHQAPRACVKTVSTRIETQKPLVKDEEAANVDVHLHRFQVTLNTSHLQAMKRNFRYLKGQPKLGLWYPKVSSFDLESYSDNDYAGANLDKKSTIGEAEYVAAAHCCGQVL